MYRYKFEYTDFNGDLFLHMLVVENKMNSVDIHREIREVHRLYHNVRSVEFKEKEIIKR